MPSGVYKRTEENKKNISKAKKEYYKIHEGYWKDKKRSKETGNKISLANKKYYKTHTSHLKGRRYIQTEEHKKAIGKAHIGNTLSNTTKQKISLANRGLKRSILIRKKQSELMKQYFKTTEGKKVRNKMSISAKKRGFTDEHRKKILKSLHLSPNKPEKLLGNLLGKDYKFVGDGQVVLGGFCPDFINVNGQKKIVEMFGDYWHKKDDYTIEKDKRRLIEYSKLGYQTLIVWEHELKDKDKLVKKIKKYGSNYGKKEKKKKSK